MVKYNVIAYRYDEQYQGQPFFIALNKLHSEAVAIARYAMDNDLLVYGTSIKPVRDIGDYELVAFGKQGKVVFVAHYPTYSQACEVADYLKSTSFYSEIRISNPNGLGDE
ncbi:MAG: hypothetical protein Q4B95_08985 [Lonepinella koalarum]|nr:hypothetical protein [Lonepinella koalarum]